MVAMLLNSHQSTTAGFMENSLPPRNLAVAIWECKTLNSAKFDLNVPAPEEHDDDNAY